jgi:hypothetical protein
MMRPWRPPSLREIHPPDVSIGDFGVAAEGTTTRRGRQVQRG